MTGPQERKPHKKHKKTRPKSADEKRRQVDSYNNSTVAKSINGLAPVDRAEAARAHAEAMADRLIKEDVFIKNRTQLIKDKYSNMLNNGNKLGSKVVTQTYDYYFAKRAKLAK